MTRITLSLLFLLLAVLPTVYGQESTAPAENLPRLYLEKVKASGWLFKGHAYEAYSYYIEGTPFYLNDDWQDGILCYDGIVYYGLSLKMQLVKDVPVLFSNDLIFPLQLPPERVNWFTIGPHRFERLVQTEDNELPQTGFYELGYRGSVSFWLRHEKEIKSSTGEQQVRYRFEKEIDYYVEKDGEFHHIRSQGSLLRALDEHRKEVKSHLKEFELSIRKQPEATISEALRYYDELKGWKEE